MAGLISKFSYQKLKQEVIFEDEDHHLERTSSVRLSRRSNWVRKMKIKRKFRVKIAGFRRFFRIRRIKFAKSSLTWAKILMRFKETQSHFGDLFAGNYLFMQVTPGSFKNNTNLVANHNYNNNFNHNKTKNKKRKPGYIDFFEFTHKNKKGAYAKDKTALFMDFAKEKMEEYKASGKFPNEYAIQREAWDICMGEDTPGRARGFGVGVTKSQVRGFRAELMDMRNEELAVYHSRSIENHLKDFASYKASTDATIEAMQTELQLYRTAYTNGIDPMSQTFGHNVERSASDKRQQQQQQQQQQQANDMVEQFLKEHFGGDEVILSATDSKIKAKQG